MDLKALAARHLECARGRTLELLEPLDDATLERQASPLMSPLVWDLAHCAHYEELWLVRRLTGSAPTDARFDDIYDAFRHPRNERPALALLDPEHARAYAREVRSRVLETLDAVELDDRDELRTGAFVYGAVVQHEQQHDETMLATIQLMEDLEYPPAHAPDPPALAGRGERDEEVLVPGSTFVMGTDTEPWAYDNERPAHEVTVAPFRIDVSPVTNAAYLEFVEGGGYRDPRLWDPVGWAWRNTAGHEHPEFWRREGGASWSRVRFGRREDLPPDEPVQHVCWYEADAFARFAGRRLPTEAEWELAASWSPGGTKLRYPWGDGAPSRETANLAGGDGEPHVARFAPAPAPVHVDGTSPWGCLQMVGDVWEWTSTDFDGYPGFRAFPYPEYSEVFFGSDYKVLRGGSWATDPVAVRGTFRNWDFPIRRQIFAGFRCARDV